MYQPENANPKTTPKTANISMSWIVSLQCHETKVFLQCKNSRCKSIADNMPETKMMDNVYISIET